MREDQQCLTHHRHAFLRSKRARPGEWRGGQIQHPGIFAGHCVVGRGKGAGEDQIHSQQAARSQHCHQAAGSAGEQLQNLHPPFQDETQPLLGLLRPQQHLPGGVMALRCQGQQLVAQGLFPQTSEKPVPLQSFQPFLHSRFSDFTHCNFSLL